MRLPVRVGTCALSFSDLVSCSFALLGGLKAEVIFVLGMVYVIETKNKIKEDKETTQPNTQASIAYTPVV